MSIVKKFFFVFASVFLSVESFSQAPSPFSSFGIGDSYGSSVVNTQGMAGVGVAQPQFWYLNNQNPALLVYNGLTVFQAGAVVDQRTIKGDTSSRKSSGGNMNYLITAFPILPRAQGVLWATSIGLMPMTSVKYKFIRSEPVQAGDPSQAPPGVNAEITEQGSGGLTQLFWNNGIKVTQDLSVGVKAAYVFSSIVNSYKNRIDPAVSPVGYYMNIEEQTYVRDFYFGGGVSYSKDSIGSKLYRLSFGATYDVASNLNAKRTTQFYRSNAIGQYFGGDTLSNVAGQIRLPSSLTLGASLNKQGFWTVGVEFGMQRWADFRGMSSEDEGLQNSWRGALGGEFTPDPQALENFLKRITFRLGVAYEQTQYVVNGNGVKDYGATFGFSLPTGRSSLDFAVKYGQRGEKEKNLFEERYLRISFGLTFNDQWFIKRKFD